MANNMHKVFISYHHYNDQEYKNTLLAFNSIYDIFIDASVDTGGINDDLSDQRIREIIRDDYLRDSTVTILLVGTETKRRKHIDWEIYSSMFDGSVNKKSGILVIQLPIVNSSTYIAAHGEEEKQYIYPENTTWVNIDTRLDYEIRYPHMPQRIIDNLIENNVKISVTDWATVTDDIEKLRYLINTTFNDRASCNYNLSRPMRRSNS